MRIGVRGLAAGALSAVAMTLGAGFVPIRKPGKLPAQTIRETYALEYGTDSLEIHSDAVKPQGRVLIVDDVLATGGTALAAAKLVRQVGGHLRGMSFLIELDFLNGRSRLEGEPLYSVLRYQS